MTRHGFIAGEGFPLLYTDFAKYARRYPLDESTIRMARANEFAVFPTNVAGEYKPEDLRSDSRFVPNLAGAAA
jgi:hypothetical protein